MIAYLQIERLHILLSPGLVYEIGPLNPHMRNELTFSLLARGKQAYSFVRKDLTFVPAPEVGTVSSPCSWARSYSTLMRKGLTFVPHELLL
jgi:hypothetical protein